MDMFRIHDMLENVSEAATTELAKGTDKVNTKEFGEVIDMIKDLSEAEKNKMEACYYKTLIDAMEESEYGEDYDEYGPMERMGYSRGGGRGGNRRGANGSQGSRGGNRGGGGSRRNYPMEDERYEDYMRGQMYYSNGAYGGGSRGSSSSGGGSSSGSSGSRYGYSYDNYMRNRSNYSTTDPEDKQERMKMLEEYSKDLITSFSDVLQDATPEEKNMLRSKLTKVVSTMQ